VHGNVVFTLSQVCAAPPGENGLGVMEEMKSVDPEEGWILKAAVRVASATDVESGNRAVEELRRAKEMLRGVCELEVVERLALETRVKDTGR
jgi:mediator of RNA polymerase II transcription subunit 18